MKKSNFNKESILSEMYEAAKDIKGMEKIYALGVIADKMNTDIIASPYSSSERLNCGCIKEYGCSCTPEPVNESCCGMCEEKCGNMDELLVSFGNFVLQNRFSKMFGVNQDFISALLTLNPTFFEISDADLRNFEEVEF